MNESTPDYRTFVPPQRFQPSAALSPDGRRVAYSSNSSGQFNLWVQAVDGGPARRLTDYTHHAVRKIMWTPDGRALVFNADHNGDEQYQIYQVSADGGPVEALTNAPGRQHHVSPTSIDATGKHLVYAVNDREPAAQDIIVHDLQSGARRRFIAPEGVVLEPWGGVSPDGRWLLAGEFRSHADMDSSIADLADPDARLTPVTPQDGHYYEPICWAPDSKGFFVTANIWGDSTSLAYFSLTERTLQRVGSLDWDIEQADAGGDTLVWSVNEAGRSVLYASRNGIPLEMPPLPNGVVTALSLSSDGTSAALLIDAATRPAEIAILDTHGGDMRYVTDTRPAGLKAVQPIEPQLVQYPARDGRTVHALAYRPHGDGPFPILMWIHGGPHGQERPHYERCGMYQYLLAQGIGIFAPNMAGSTGFGTPFQKLIYKDWGGIDLSDFEDGLTYLQSVDWADAGHVAVAGASYGGFAALSCVSRIEHPWAAGISICGPSNLVTLATNCPPTWRSFVDTVLGNPTTDAEALTERSPLTYVDQITAPLFIVQGAHDPRVPKAESDQIVDRLRARGVEVRYDIYGDEGHGFTSRDNEIAAYSDIAAFLVWHLR